MANQDDRWTRWKYWFEADDKRNVEHIASEVEGWAGLPSSMSMLGNDSMLATYAVQMELSAGTGDYVGAFWSCRSALNRLHLQTMILMYAVYECRQLIHLVSTMTKEEVFDLWLDRASELDI